MQKNLFTLHQSSILALLTVSMTTPPSSAITHKEQKGKAHGTNSLHSTETYHYKEEFMTSQTDQKDHHFASSLLSAMFPALLHVPHHQPNPT